VTGETKWYPGEGNASGAEVGTDVDFPERPSYEELLTQAESLKTELEEAEVS